MDSKSADNGSHLDVGSAELSTLSWKRDFFGRRLTVKFDNCLTEASSFSRLRAHLPVHWIIL